VMVGIIQGLSPSWEAGYKAGMSGHNPRRCPRKVPDCLAFWSGVFEGKAARERAQRLKNRDTSFDSAESANALVTRPTVDPQS
jgi:ribosome modulation factor